ncbi:MAG: GIY-YIG nuclease family protein [Actinobacteria bacterium]|nr:GIY-YIG nuclease family protein [Actinomycetota bacterium]
MTGHVGEHPYRGFAPRAGIYSITCQRTGKTYVGCTDHLVGAMNGHRFKLANGMHPNRVMQADYDAYGDTAFDFSIHDEIAAEEYADTSSADLDALRDLWVDQLGLDEGRTY